MNWENLATRFGSLEGVLYDTCEESERIFLDLVVLSVGTPRKLPCNFLPRKSFT